MLRLALRDVRPALEFVHVVSSIDSSEPFSQPALELLGRRTEEALELVERGGEVIPIERAKGRQPALQMEEVEIRATGTEGKLVPVGEGQSRPRTVASAGEGGGNKPLRAASPSSSAGTRATGGRGGGTVAAAALHLGREPHIHPELSQRRPPRH